MITNDNQTGCFVEYTDSVRVLEQAFSVAGFPIEFALFVSPGGIKYAEVLYPKPPIDCCGDLLNLNNISPLKAVALLARLVRAEGL
jgi:hypothetical protein